MRLRNQLLVLPILIILGVGIVSSVIYRDFFSTYILERRIIFEQRQANQFIGLVQDFSRVSTTEVERFIHSGAFNASLLDYDSVRLFSQRAQVNEVLRSIILTDLDLGYQTRALSYLSREGILFHIDFYDSSSFISAITTTSEKLMTNGVPYHNRIGVSSSLFPETPLSKNIVTFLPTTGGIFFIYLNHDRLEELLPDSSLLSGSIQLLDSDFSPIWQPFPVSPSEQSEIQELLKSENSAGVMYPFSRNRLFYFFEVPNNSVIYTSIIDRKYIDNPAFSFQLIEVLVIIGVLFLTFVLCWFFSRIILEPISRLTRGMKDHEHSKNSGLLFVSRGFLKNAKFLTKVMIFFFLTTLLPTVLYFSLAIPLYRVSIQNRLLDYITGSGDLYFSDVASLINQLDVENRKLIYNHRFTSQGRVTEKNYWEARDLGGKIIARSGDFPLIMDTLEHYSGHHNSVKLSESVGNFLYLDMEIVNNLQFLVFGRKIFSTETNSFGRQTGTFLLFIQADELFGKLSSSLSPRDISGLITDRDGNPLYSQSLRIAQNIDISELLTNRVEDFIINTASNTRIAITKRTTLDGNLMVFGLASLSDIDNTIQNAIRLAVLSAALVIAVVMIISGIFSFKISSPLVDLSQYVRSQYHSEGSFDSPSIPISKNNEIMLLVYEFHSMMERIKNLIQQNQEALIREHDLILLEKKAELDALERQINPHFLYNVLDAINWNAFSAGNTEISTMCTALGRYFRWITTRDSDFVLVSEDIEALKDYMYIQSIRYGDRLQFVVETEATAESTQIPKFILQPLVENALIHGLEPTERGVTVRLTVKKNKDFVHLKVSDNGAGMSGERLVSIRNRIQEIRQYNPGENRTQVKKHIGLDNVITRLFLLYGKSLKIHISSTLDKGTEVVIHLPNSPDVTI